MIGSRIANKLYPICIALNFNGMFFNKRTYFILAQFSKTLHINVSWHIKIYFILKSNIFEKLQNFLGLFDLNFCLIFFFYTNFRNVDLLLGHVNHGRVLSSFKDLKTHGNLFFS